MFDNLSEAANMFTGWEIGVLVLMMFWVEVIWQNIFGRDFGIAIINYLVPIGAFLAHLAAVISYFDISQVSLYGDCKDERDDPKDVPGVCATHGPALIITELLVIFCTVCLYLVIYWQRHKETGFSSSQSLQPPKESENRI